MRLCMDPQVVSVIHLPRDHILMVVTQFQTLGMLERCSLIGRKMCETQACHASVGGNSFGRSGVPDHPGLQKLWFKEDRQTRMGAQVVEGLSLGDIKPQAPFQHQVNTP